MTTRRLTSALEAKRKRILREAAIRDQQLSAECYALAESAGPRWRVNNGSP
jgi:hypothetical protein